MNVFDNLGVNKALLVGKVSKSPRRHVINDVTFICFTLETEELIKKNGKKLKHYEYHSVKIPLASFETDAEFRKGDYVYIQGKIQTQIFFDDVQVKRYKTEVIASIIQVFGDSCFNTLSKADSKFTDRPDLLQ